MTRDDRFVGVVVAPSRLADRSVGGDDTETLVVEGARAVLVKAQRASTWQPAQSPAQRQIDWPDQPTVLSDVELAVAHRPWADAEGLDTLLRRATGHVYLVALRHVGTMLDALSLLGRHPAADLQVTPVSCYGHQLRVGPLLSAAGVPCGSCLARRSLDASSVLRQRHQRGHAMVRPSRPDALLATVRTLWEVEAPARAAHDQLVVDLRTGRVDTEPALPYGDCACSAGLVASAVGLDQLLGAAVAPLQGLRSELGPGGTTTSTAWSNAPGLRLLGGGTDLDPGQARLRAAAEAVERLGLLHLVDRSVRGSWAQLSGDDPLGHLQMFDDDQLGSTEAWERLDPHLVTSWVPAVRLRDDSATRLPVDYVGLRRGPDDPRLAPMGSNGSAAHTTEAAATRAALVELAERDVATIAWLTADLWRLRSNDPLVRRLEADDFDVTLAQCLRDPVVPVVIAEVGERDSGWCALGSAAGADLAAAGRRAVNDAVQMWLHRRQTGRLLPAGLADRIAGEAVPSAGAEPVDSTAAIIAAYDPYLVRAGCVESAIAGLHVVSVWSPSATGFPDPGRPVPPALRRRLPWLGPFWQPSHGVFG